MYHFDPQIHIEVQGMVSFWSYGPSYGIQIGRSWDSAAQGTCLKKKVPMKDAALKTKIDGSWKKNIFWD